MIVVGGVLLAGCGTSGNSRGPDTTPVFARVPTTVPSATSDAPAPYVPSAAPHRSRASSTPAGGPATSGSTQRRTDPPPPSTRQTLPLRYPTADATQVITVTASTTGSTTATVQAWTRSDSGWLRSGARIPAFLGTQGMSADTNEGLSATPMGSFTLTQAFGRAPDPGSRLPYRQTTPADWWISQPGPLYNTWQHCAANCSFTQGDPNEHLYEITPWYDYAVVIDYNRDPVHQGAGSAFFLHVSVGEPTAGCVAVPRADMVRLLTWLDPAAHPRILIGTA